MPQSQTQGQGPSDQPQVSQKLVRRLEQLEQQMREYLPGFTRIPAVETRNQVNYFIKLMETFLNADSGTFHDAAVRQLILEKLWLEYYIWQNGQHNLPCLW